MSENQDSLVWYKSPNYRNIIISGITQVVALVGYQDVISGTHIDFIVGVAFQLVALVATWRAEVARRKSVLQPITLKEKKDEVPGNAFAPRTSGVSNNASKPGSNAGSSE